jgi:phenylalanyl-tRNA synthetase beta chain
LRLFEFGNIYFYHAEKGKRNPLDKYQENFVLDLFITGRKHEPNWISSETKTSIYELKAFLNNILIRLGIELNQIVITSVENKRDLYHDGLLYKLNNIVVAELAVISQSVTDMFDIRSEVYYASINWVNLIKIRGEHHVTYKELARFPEVRRDLALLIDQSVSYERIRDLAFKTEKTLLSKVDLFDVYEGEQIEKGKKSYAVSFILQDTQATLTDERIDQVMKKLIEAYIKTLGAVIR